MTLDSNAKLRVSGQTDVYEIWMPLTNTDALRRAFPTGEVEQVAGSTVVLSLHVDGRAGLYPALDRIADMGLEISDVRPVRIRRPRRGAGPPRRA